MRTLTVRSLLNQGVPHEHTGATIPTTQMISRGLDKAGSSQLYDEDRS
jgi:hypothetical protein